MGWNFRETLRDELDYQGLTVKELAAKSMVFLREKRMGKSGEKGGI